MIGFAGRTYFTEKELGCRHCGMVRLAPGFGEKLLELRLAFGEPMVINSACRCAEHNKRVGGHARSLHVADKPAHPTGGCCAIDVGTRDIGYRARLAKVALDLGWAVGVNAAFLHLDRGADYGVRNGIQMFLY